MEVNVGRYLSGLVNETFPNVIRIFLRGAEGMGFDLSQWAA